MIDAPIDKLTNSKGKQARIRGSKNKRKEQQTHSPKKTNPRKQTKKTVKQNKAKHNIG